MSKSLPIMAVLAAFGMAVSPSSPEDQNDILVIDNDELTQTAASLMDEHCPKKVSAEALKVHKCIANAAGIMVVAANAMGFHVQGMKETMPPQFANSLLTNLQIGCHTPIQALARQAHMGSYTGKQYTYHLFQAVARCETAMQRVDKELGISFGHIARKKVQDSLKPYAEFATLIK